MEGYPNWADSGCGCLAILGLSLALMFAGILLMGSTPW